MPPERPPADAARGRPLNGLALTIEQQAILMLLDRVEALEREVRELRRDVDAEQRPGGR